MMPLDKVAQLDDEVQAINELEKTGVVQLQGNLYIAAQLFTPQVLGGEGDSVQLNQDSKPGDCVQYGGVIRWHQI